MSFCVGPASAARTSRSFKVLAGTCDRFESLSSVNTRLSDAVGIVLRCVFSGKRRLAAYLRGELEILAVEEAHHRLRDIVGLNEA